MSPLKRTFWLGAGLILLTNAVALGGVYYNRSGEPASVLTLSERELTVAYRGFLDDSDYASRVLRLDWRVADGWVTADKLRALGFTVPDDSQTYWRHREEREGLVVLELDGPYYQAQLKAAQAALASSQQAALAAPDDAKAKVAMDDADYELQRLSAITTRLYVVDAGLDAASLRERYADTAHYAIARAGLRVGTRYYDESDRGNDYSLYADLNELNVPSQWSEVFREWPLYGRDAEDRSKVRVALAFGKRFEPWVIRAEKVE
ncbi:MAG: DUF4824 family protein [Pseudomonas sp.]|uniref:DUF4824 family protein n=1 Tax=Pseudomonas sp. TaxID=306 RepID=UPI0030F09987